MCNKSQHVTVNVKLLMSYALGSFSEKEECPSCKAQDLESYNAIEVNIFIKPDYRNECH